MPGSFFPRLLLRPSLYDGLAATRASAPSVLRPETQAMARTAFFTRAPVNSLAFIIPNWSGAEIPPGSPMNVNINVEYPAGTFASVVSATIPSGGQVKLTVPVNIPVPAQAWYRGYYTNPSGIPACSFQGQNLALGDALIVGNSGVADLTAGGTVTDGGTFSSIAPLAIIAPITIPSVCILGDSIALGVNNDHVPNSTGDNGEIAPSIAPSFGYSNMGVNGDTASGFVSTHANRAAVLQYCSHLIVEYGTNDIYLNQDSVATLQGNLTTIYGLAAPGTTIFQNTLLPRSSTPDGQTPITASGEESRRVAFNAALRAGTFGPNGGLFDPEPVVGTGTNNSLWIAGETNDGVHPTTHAYYTLLQNSGYIDLSRIHR